MSSRLTMVCGLWLQWCWELCIHSSQCVWWTSWCPQTPVWWSWSSSMKPYLQWNHTYWHWLLWSQVLSLGGSLVLELGCILLLQFLLCQWTWHCPDQGRRLSQILGCIATFFYDFELFINLFLPEPRNVSSYKLSYFCTTCRDVREPKLKLSTESMETFNFVLSVGLLIIKDFIRFAD